jgi:hypothetical protein
MQYKKIKFGVKSSFFALIKIVIVISVYQINYTNKIYRLIQKIWYDADIVLNSNFTLEIYYDCLLQQNQILTLVLYFEIIYYS